MIIIKSPREIELMKAAGAVVAGVFEAIKPLMRPGVSTKVIADKAESYIKSKVLDQHLKDIMVSLDQFVYQLMM